MSLSVPGPLAAYRVMVVGDSRAARFATDLLAGLGASLVVPREAGRHRAHALRDPEPTLQALRTATDLDALVTIGPSSVIQTCGLGRAESLALWPNLTYVQVDEAGPTTCSGGERSVDPWVLASFGAMLGFSDPGDSRPLELPVGDFASALTAVLGVTASLAASGGSAPALVETSAADASSIITVDPITQSMVDGTEVSRSSRHPWAQLFAAKCADGSGIGIHLSSSEAFWLKFTTAIDRPDLVERPEFATYHDRVRNYSDLEVVVAEAFLARTVEEWEAILSAADVPFAPLLTPQAALDHAQTSALHIASDTSVPHGDTLLSPVQFDGGRVRRDRVADREEGR